MKTKILVSLFLFSTIFSFSQHNHKCSRANKSLNYTMHPQNDTLDVLDYNINLNITDFTNKIIRGNTIVNLTFKKDNITKIKLDLLKLNVDSVKIDNILTTFSYNDTLLQINTLAPLNITDTVNVNVYYGGTPMVDPTGWGGFYFSGNTAYNLGVGFSDTPHSYGRVWFPCLDDFTDRAYYTCNITVPETLKAICGGTLQNEVNNGDATKTFSWVLHNTIPTYLASIAVSDYASVDGVFNGINGAIPTNIYVAPNQVSNANASFINLNPTLNTFEQHFGPYMWERVGYVSVPFSSGAMEHATNIAYPSVCINGNLSYETLYSHELSHHWFGDLVTCRTPEDMWLNEGWASYCESIFMENIYGDLEFKNYQRDNHYNVLKNAHIDDGGYFPVSGIPQTITYGSTVYNKGADAVHSLRYYLGNHFFTSVQSYLTDFSFKDASSEDLRDHLANTSGINLTNFFDSWIFKAGFSQFEIDSFNVAQNGINYDVTVYVKQKLRAKTEYANSNKIPISFMKPDWSYVDTTITFSGQTGSQTYTIPFNPYSVWIDRNEQVMDASVKIEKTFKAIGYLSLTKSELNLQVTNITDSAKLRVVHNWVAPDYFNDPYITLSNSHYWRIDGYFPNNFICRAKFVYNSNYLDDSLINISPDSLILMYRKDKTENWRIISNNCQGNAVSGYIQTDTLKIGEYCLAERNISLGWLNLENNSQNKYLKIYPNPVTDTFSITSNYQKNGKIVITSTNGNFLLEKQIEKNTTIELQKHNFKNTVIVTFLNAENKIIETQKIVFK